MLAALVLAGCGGARGLAVTTPAWQATIAITPWPPAGVTPHEVVVIFTRGRPAPPIVLQMDMPEMAHAMVRVPLRATAPGRFEGSAAFAMAGTWRLILTAGAPPVEGTASVTVRP